MKKNNLKKNSIYLPSPSSCKILIFVNGISAREFSDNGSWKFGCFTSDLSNVCRRCVFVKYVFDEDDDEGI